MACFWPLYEQCREKWRIENCIIDLKRSNAKTIIKLYCEEGNINLDEELDTLNTLYDKFNISDYGFDQFFVKKTVFLKNNMLPPTTLFLIGSEKKMEKVNPEEILSHFNNLVSYARAKNLESIARSVSYLATKIENHNLEYHCHCFSCQICRIFLSALFERKPQKYFDNCK